MSNPVRLQLSRRAGFRLPAGAVNVARPGPWGNPFIVGKHGTRAECVHLFSILVTGGICMSVDRECHLAQAHFWKHAKAHVEELRGKDLACWCPLDKECHADVLLILANGEPRPGKVVSQSVSEPVSQNGTQAGSSLTHRLTGSPAHVYPYFND